MSDHVKIENTKDGKYRMFCTHCGRDYIPALPVAVDMFVAMTRQFERSHRDCPEPDTNQDEKVESVSVALRGKAKGE